MEFQLITIENPYLCFEQGLVRKLFAELCLLRFQGYGPDYPLSFLPFEKHDFVSVHHLFCGEGPEGPTVLGAFKQVTLATCDDYSLEIPLLSVFKEFGQNAPHAAALERIIEQHRSSGWGLVHSSGLTIRKELRKDRELSARILALVAALVVHDMREWGIRTALTGAAMRFKTHLHFQSWGYSPLALDGRMLPPLERTSIRPDDHALGMVLTEPSFVALRMLRENAGVIRNRMLLRPAPATPLRKAA